MKIFLDPLQSWKNHS